MHKSIMPFNSYARYANHAARAEQRGEYDHASKLWRRAQSTPCSAVNQAWAEGREDTCLYKARLPRRAPYAGQ